MAELANNAPAPSPVEPLSCELWAVRIYRRKFGDHTFALGVNGVATFHDSGKARKFKRELADQCLIRLADMAVVRVAVTESRGAK